MISTYYAQPAGAPAYYGRRAPPGLRARQTADTRLGGAIVVGRARAVWSLRWPFGVPVADGLSAVVQRLFLARGLAISDCLRSNPLLPQPALRGIHGRRSTAAA